MKIKKLDDIKKKINKNVSMSLLVMVAIAIFILQITQYTFEASKQQYLKEQLNANIALYNSNLSEKLYFLANATTFIDYLNSGEVTQRSLNYEIDKLINSLKIDEIKGIVVTNRKKMIELERGTTSQDYIKLDLCYFNQMLNKEYGSCDYQMTVYFDKDLLIKKYQSINHHITFCKKCIPSLLLPEEKLGSLNVIEHSNTQANLHIPEQNDNLFIWLNYLLMIILFTFALWNRHWVNRIVHLYLHLPLSYIVNSIPIKKRLKSNAEYIDEYNQLITNINNWKVECDAIQLKEEAIALGKLAAQVAHDIRSPLTALEIVYHQNEVDNNELKNIYRNALSRIHEIANQLLKDYKGSFQQEIALVKVHGPLPFYLENIVILKNIEYQNKAHIELNYHDNTSFSFITCDMSIFKRIISNLINNAIEAYSVNHTNIYIVVKVTSSKDTLIIDIIDKGSGMPVEIINKIFDEGFSFNKPHGTGLGLYDVQKHVSAWGGKIMIDSTINKGTKVSIIFPRETVPAWILTELHISASKPIVIIDDDRAIYHIWKKRLHNLGISDQQMIYFDTISDFERWLKPKSFADYQFIFDVHFSNESLNGLDIIKKWHLSKYAIAVSNYSDDHSILDQCEKLQIKLLPKSYICKIDITIEKEFGMLTHYSAS